MKETNIALTSIHPFTPRQADIVRLYLSGVSCHEDVANALGIALNTVHNEIKGTSAMLDEDNPGERWDSWCNRVAYPKKTRSANVDNIPLW